MATVQGFPADAPRGSVSVGSPVPAAPPPPGPAVGAGSLSASHNKNSRTARASTPGVATPGPVDPEAEGAGEDDDAKSDPELPSDDADLAPGADTTCDPIDMETFLQILDLDEEDNHEFSRGMAWAYFDQVASTFGDMDKALDQSSLPTLSSLGHFLKGSSAALGVCKVQRSCEQIQHYGELRDEEHDLDLEEDEALGRIREVLTRVKEEYAEAEKWLKEYYAKSDGDA